jgi:hypothetical protein
VLAASFERLTDAERDAFGGLLAKLVE